MRLPNSGILLTADYEWIELNIPLHKELWDLNCNFGRGDLDGIYMLCSTVGVARCKKTFGYEYVRFVISDDGKKVRFRNHVRTIKD